MSLSDIDLAIVAIYLLAVLGFGLWVGRGQRNLNDYFLADRDLPWWAVLLSIVATETSTVTFLSIPGAAFKEGNLTFLQIAVGYIVGRFLVAYVLLPAYYLGIKYTAYELLEKRVGRTTRQASSAVFMVTRTLADGLRLLLTALVLHTAVGLDVPFCIIVMGVVTIVYTVVGGVRSVVWNDCIQFAVYILGAIIAAVVIVTRIPGGLSELSTFAEQGDRLRFFDFDFSLTKPTITFWSGLIGGAFLTIATHGADQMMVQRYLAARSLRDARLAVLCSGVVVFVQFLLFLLIGVGLACFYSIFPPTQAFATADEVFARFIVTQLPIGVVGIVLAAVFSAAISTLSGSLNSSATAFVGDFYTLLHRSATDRELLWVGRGATFAFGVLQMVVAIASYEIALDRTIVSQVLGIAGYTTSLILGLLALCLLQPVAAIGPKVRQVAALCGFVVGFLVITYVAFWTPISWPWYTLIGSTTTVLAAWIATPLMQLLLGRAPETSD
jgi:SSS family transporter